jgi:hypothetical protein
MPKTLKATKTEKCNGCELCVLESQRQLEKIGLEGSLIRIFISKDPEKEYPKFNLDIDPRTNSIDIEKIKIICPKSVFEIEE